MVKVKQLSQEQALSLAELTEEIAIELWSDQYNLEVDNQDPDFPNKIYLDVPTEYGTKRLFTFVQYGDTAESIYEVLKDKLDEFYHRERVRQQIEDERYEHSSITEGYVFNLVICN